ncbi:MAG: hypothetical protein WEB00_00215 [Dehalococcoidia bacterium]
MPELWWSELRRLHDGMFGLVADWRHHVRSLNERLPELRDAPLTTPGNNNLPPTLFNGDIEALQAGRWLLVISLNPAMETERKQAWYKEAEFEPDSYWHHWRTYNKRFYYSRFFDPLVIAARTTLEIREDKPPKHVATEDMCFIEVCPYASRNFSSVHGQVLAKLQDDPAIQGNAQFRDHIIERGSPAAILVNGNAAIEEFDRLPDVVDWRRSEYVSVDEQERGLWWKHGTYMTPERRSLPLFGVPFLGRRYTANSHNEYRQLGKMIAAKLGS